MSSTFDIRIGSILKDYEFKQARLQERQAEVLRRTQLSQDYLTRAKAMQYLVMLSDDGTKALREYMEGIINRALALVFGEGVYKFSLISDLKAQKVSLNLLEFKDGRWNELEIGAQTGDGMGQIIAFLFSVVLTEITNHRMLFVVDELMGGLHEKAVELVQRCIAEFENHGGQFAMIEYTFNKFGTQVDLMYDETSENTSVVGVSNYPLVDDEADEEEVTETTASVEVAEVEF